MDMKVRFVGGVVGTLCACAWSLNKNQSVEFGQDLNRNASIESDAAFHNPAGVSFLPLNGLYVGGGNQTILQQRTIEEPTPLLDAYGQPQYKGDIRSWVFPTLHAAYRMDALTFFAHGGPLGGGGRGEFDQGLPQFDNMILAFASGVGQAVKAGVDAQAGAAVTTGATPTFQYQRDLSFTGDEMTLGATAGAAYKVLPTLSVAAAYRFSYARNAYKGTAKVSKLGVTYAGSAGGAAVDAAINSTANGTIQALWKDVAVDVVATGVSHSVVLGADFKPDDIWNVGVRFEWNGEMRIENDTKTLTAPDGLLPALNQYYADGVKTKITEPMILAGGVSFKGVQDLTIESSWTYGFAELVDRDTAENNFHNSLFAGLGLRYQLLPTVEVSTGYAHDWAFRNDAGRIETDLDLPTHFLTAGVGVQATPRLKIDAGAMVGIGQDRHGISVASSARQKMSSDLLSFGLGLEWSPKI